MRGGGGGGGGGGGWRLADGMQVALRMQAGYDHSYYFISSFIDDHIKHHAEQICA